MGLFRKKPTEFDERQDKALNQLIVNQKQIIKNQGVLIKNNDYNIAEKKKIWSWITNLDKRLKNVQASIVAMKETDKKFAQMFQGLASLSATKAEAETVTTEG